MTGMTETSGPAMSPEKLLQSAENLSSLPSTAQKVIEVVSDAGSDASDLERVISIDPTLTAKLLRVVNSAFYSFATPVADIRRAIVILGFSSVRSLALSISVCQLFRSDNKIGDYSRADLWRHSVAVGLTAKMVCRRTGMADSEEGFVAGMLHDIGMIVEDQYAHKQFVQVLTASQAGGGHLCSLEQKALGTTHAGLGGRLADKWRFPKGVSRAISMHHNPASAGSEDALAHILHVSDFIACAKGIGYGIAKVPPPSMESVGILKMTKKDIVVMAEDLDEEMEKAGELLKI